MSVKVTIHRGKVIQVVGPMVERAAYRGAQKARSYVIAEMRAAGRIDTGNMIARTQARLVSGSDPLRRRYEVSSSVPYVMFQNDGTRDHGPRKARFMVFTPKGSGQVVFAKWVRGVQGAHFFEKGLARLRVSDFT